MAWRSVVITQPAKLKLQQRALVVLQDDGPIRIPLEDIAVIVIDQPQVLLTAALLGACADQQVCVITTGSNHHPNGTLTPYLPHSRALKVIRNQLAMTQPQRKQLWQCIIRRKITNQANVLSIHGQNQIAKRLYVLSRRVRSGDTSHTESQAAQQYFRPLFGMDFTRTQDRLANAAMNYGYSIIRAALARQLVAYGFITALGLHHRNELNPFNLADDLLEPFRPILDNHVLALLQRDSQERELTRDDKAWLVNILHQDVPLETGDGTNNRTTVLVATEAAAISLSQRTQDKGTTLTLPRIDPPDDGSRVREHHE